MRILIVEKSIEIQNRLKEILKTIDGVLFIDQVYDPFSAIESIMINHPELVIMEINFSYSGIEALRYIKRNPGSPRIIILTNETLPQYRKKCKELGAEFFFDKTQDFDKIKNTIYELMKSEKMQSWKK
jgi:DNA-binding NarL/FixJ family response regulator